MSRRFIPPSVDLLVAAPRTEAASEAEVAREDGFAEGLRLGRQEGHLAGLREGEDRAAAAYALDLAEIHEEAARQNTIGDVVSALERLRDVQSETRRALEAATRQALASAMQTLFPTLMAQTAGQEIATLVAETLAERDVDTLTLRADPTTVAEVVDQGLSESEVLTLIADPHMKPGAAVASWSSGGVSFDPDRLLRQVLSVLCPQPASEEALAE